MIVLPVRATPERRWLAHLVRVAAGSLRSGDRFDDDLVFESEPIAQLARRHRVAPLLHSGFASGRIADPVPTSFRAACSDVYHATARKSAVALEVGSAVLAELAAAGVAAAALKGHALMDGPCAVYEDPALRPVDDVDLIVARGDVDRAIEVLGGLGFEPISDRRAVRLAGGHEIAFHRRVGGIPIFVELHWAWAGSESLLRPFAIPGADFLQHFCWPVQDGRMAATRLGHLLFVAVHAARHAFERWIWLLDLHRLVERGPLDWSRVVRTARVLRVRRPLYAGLVASRELLRTAVPKEVLVALAPGPVRRQLLHRSLAASQEPTSTERSGQVAKLLLGESWWDVARTAAWAASPGPDWYAERGRAAPLRGRVSGALRRRSSHVAGGRRPAEGDAW